MLVMAGSANHSAAQSFHLRLARHGLLVDAGFAFRPVARATLVALFELRQNFLAEQLDRGTEKLVRNPPGLGEANHLIDTNSLEFPQAGAKHLRSAYAILNTPFRRHEFVGIGVELMPDIGLARLMLAKEAVMSKAIDEIAVVFHAKLQNALFVAVAEKR